MKKFIDLTYEDLIKMDEDTIMRLAINDIEAYFELIDHPELKRELMQSLWHLRSEVKKLPTILNKIQLVKRYILTLHQALTLRGI